MMLFRLKQRQSILEFKNQLVADTNMRGGWKE
jgi:hypothetical protein